MYGLGTQNADHLLLETRTDNCESAVVYTYVHEDGVSILDATDSTSIPILPAGFVVVPVLPINGITAESCLLTVSLQTLASTNPYDTIRLSIAVQLQRQLTRIINRIKMALSGAMTMH